MRVFHEQPKRQQELPLAQRAMKFAQFVYRIVFAGGQFLAIHLREIQQFISIGLAGQKIRLDQQR